MTHSKPLTPPSCPCGAAHAEAQTNEFYEFERLLDQWERQALSGLRNSYQRPDADALDIDYYE